MSLPSYIRPTDEGSHLDVFVQPRAARDGVVGLHGAALKLKVQAPAQDDKANRAVVALAAAALGIPKNRVEIVAGHRSRHKTLLLSGVRPEDAATMLERAIGSG